MKPGPSVISISALAWCVADALFNWLGSGNFRLAQWTEDSKSEHFAGFNRRLQDVDLDFIGPDQSHATIRRRNNRRMLSSSDRCVRGSMARATFTKERIFASYRSSVQKAPSWASPLRFYSSRPDHSDQLRTRWSRPSMSDLNPLAGCTNLRALWML